MKKWLLLPALLLGGCTSNLIGLRGNSDAAIEEIRTEIADLRHAIHGTEVEIKLIEERLEHQDENPSMEKKIASLEKTIEKMNTELRALMAYASQTTASLSQYKDHISQIDRRLEEIGRLRSTLSQLSKSEKTHLVKSGDSLEKIARLHAVSIEAIKRENNLSSDRIIIGQELKIPQ